jgi:hypothetical protein
MDYFPDNTPTHFTTRLPQRTPLQKKFDIGMNEIDHKIGIAVKKNC